MRRFFLVTVLRACTLGGTGNPPAGFDYHDALPTATRNKWDAVTMPQPGDPTYPGGKYRTVTPDSTGAIHPGCSTTGQMYTPATIAGYPCVARQFDFPQGVTEDTTKPIVILVHGTSDGPSGYIKFLHPA